MQACLACKFTPKLHAFYSLDICSEYAHKLEKELGHKPRFLVQVSRGLCWYVRA